MIRKLTDKIYYLQGQEQTDRPFIYYIQGEKASLAVEAGESANHIAYFYEELKKAGLSRPDYTVITHWHWDHTFGMHAVSGKTIASVQTNAKLKEMKEWEWSDEAIDNRLKCGEEIPYCALCMKAEYPYLSDIIITEADEEIQSETVIDLGEVTCRIIPHNTTHSRDALFVYVPEEKVLAIGDADYEDYYDGDYKYDKEILGEMAGFIESFDFELYLRGHEGIMTRAEAMAFLEAQKNNQKQSIVAPGNGIV